MSQNMETVSTPAAKEAINGLIARLVNEKLKLETKNVELCQWVDDLQAGMYINCVYCGHRYGPDDKVPASMAQVLKDHVEHCPKHPMSALKADNERLREEQDKCRRFLRAIHDSTDAALCEEEGQAEPARLKPHAEVSPHVMEIAELETDKEGLREILANVAEALDLEKGADLETFIWGPCEVSGEPTPRQALVLRIRAALHKEADDVETRGTSSVQVPRKPFREGVIDIPGADIAKEEGDG